MQKIRSPYIGDPFLIISLKVFQKMAQEQEAGLETESYIGGINTATKYGCSDSEIVTANQKQSVNKYGSSPLALHLESLKVR